MDLPRLGHAIIINNIQAEVAGSARDVLSLQRAYETVGFDVQVHTDCTSKVYMLSNLYFLFKQKAFAGLGYQDKFVFLDNFLKSLGQFSSIE